MEVFAARQAAEANRAKRQAAQAPVKRPVITVKPRAEGGNGAKLDAEPKRYSRRHDRPSQPRSANAFRMDEIGARCRGVRRIRRSTLAAGRVRLRHAPWLLSGWTDAGARCRGAFCRSALNKERREASRSTYHPRQSAVRRVASSQIYAHVRALHPSAGCRDGRILAFGRPTCNSPQVSARHRTPAVSVAGQKCVSAGG